MDQFYILLRVKAEFVGTDSLKTDGFYQNQFFIENYFSID